MKYLVWFSAFVLAACAAIISVSGLGQLFAGAGILVMLAMGGLEMTKLVAAGALHRYWDRLNVMIRLYMTSAVVVLVLITSLGIYGFLSGGYQQTETQLGIEDTKIELLENKKNVYETRIGTNEKLVDYKTGRATTLTELRNNQEVRLDSLLAKNYITNANRVRKDISEANEEIQKLNDDVDEIMVLNATYADSSAHYAELMSNVAANSEHTADIGPLKHLSEATGLARNTVIDILMLLLVFVFDPMAVSLLILGNTIWELEKEEPKSEKPKKMKKERKPWNIMGKLKALTPSIPKIFKKKPVAVIPPAMVDPETGHIDLGDTYDEELAKSAFTQTHKGVVTKGKIDEDDLPVLRGDNKGKVWFKRGRGK